MKRGKVSLKHNNKILIDLLYISNYSKLEPNLLNQLLLKIPFTKHYAFKNHIEYLFSNGLVIDTSIKELKLIRKYPNRDIVYFIRDIHSDEYTLDLFKDRRYYVLSEDDLMTYVGGLGIIITEDNYSSVFLNRTRMTYSEVLCP